MAEMLVMGLKRLLIKVDFSFEEVVTISLVLSSWFSFIMMKASLA
jgi:hypothetical protein